MTERNPALWMQNRTDHTAEQERALITGLYLGKEGVMGQDDLKVVQRAAGVNMSVDVGPGRATVFGDDNANQGCYAVWNDAAKNVTLAASHATNGRKDIIVARIKDAFYSGASNTFTLEVITGTPAGAADGSGASDPTIPNNCLPLARVTVVATATSIADAKITDLRNRVGTMSSCDVECTATTRPATPFTGMRIFETNTTKTQIWSGSAWVCVSRLSGRDTWTPVVAQSVTNNIAKTVVLAEYEVINNICNCWFILNVTGTGTAGSGVSVSLPIPSVGVTFRNVGSGLVYDASAGTVDIVSLQTSSLGVVSFASSRGAGDWGQTPSIAMANGDIIRGFACYPVA